ncbi:MAG: bifunctional 1-(5-phosphoribosyl)-5-((5-phosphoribosylamino)methylideneamino)imidazole-4-carboxamide isomerase/phosphoribosylanthranilate isomerase PriA [Candidatus Ancillula trichonymphae]|jgi:1-(5-phosphoribosyl)-5-[(5-phosphoribosylamino)methylideneamino] imidazole-4-carboxamide isomerase/N-(5'phosphoribosyl)anthranilate isomerase|nr:bifunctional 1-(5-phosphoribosyl)-5-((5-phosphoribosylamino)methylideneamino)imidazole-4-carboxamide isomerase/phosphoribosylanthranilate isomerase PriA [Candidatus Ancillula trichonymphae]
MHDNLELVLLPAIDISDGCAVRLLCGELNEQTVYASPQEVAQDFAAVYAEHAGNNWVHLVDLDAAFGRGNNARIIEEVVEILKAHDVSVELSGGIRGDEQLEHAISIGASRVNIGTSALEDPEWTARAIKKYGDKLAVGLDVRGVTLAARGWVKECGNLWEVVDRLVQDGASRFVVTDVNKDGTLQGPNLQLLEEVAQHVGGTGIKITASGGISNLEDLAKLRDLLHKTGGIIDSVIFGRALYSKQFTLEQALTMCVNSN